jgi:Tryptophan-associated transmembrane protein (Trp_oprn_chp)
MIRTRKGMTLVVVACLAASALVLLASSRVWGEVSVPRPAPLGPMLTKRTGSDFASWLPALGAVGLAGAGALVATRGIVRLVVGAVLLVSGVGVVAVALPPLGSGASAFWPVLASLCGLVVAGAGVLALAAGRAWPAMGARYERPAQKAAARKPASQAELWDALDRGEDPT